MGRDQELLEAARNGNIEHVGKLLEQIAKRAAGPLSSFRRSPSINGQDTNGYTPLHHACLNGHTNVVRLILAHDALPDVPDIRGSTPLYLAAWAGHHDIVKMLLMHPRKPANPNAQTIDNETPLHCAAQHGHNAALAILLAYGADPTIRNNSFQTALDLAANFGRLQAVQMLIRTHPELIEPYRVATANSFDLSNYLPQNYAATTPTKHIFTHSCLHLASRNGHKKIVEILLEAGVDVNILTPAGTALHEAALCGKKSVVNTLLSAGIDPHAKDGNGRTALDLLKEYPPHVTYEIVTVIEDFCKPYENINHFKPISTDNDSENSTEFITTTENDMRQKSHSIPKSASIKKLNEHMPKLITKSNAGLSSSLNSLEKIPQTPENYVSMKPIPWQKSAADIKATNALRTDYEEYEPHSLSNANGVSTSMETKAVRPKPKPFEFKCINQPEKKSIKVINPATRYHCVDEYVPMTNLIEQNSNTSSSNIKVASPRNFNKGDYANINEITTKQQISRENRHNNSASITPTRIVAVAKLDANNNSKQHSPTPDFPPPTVSQAEDAILEFIHPPRTLTKKPSKRRSIHIEYTEHTDDDLESFVMKHINLNEDECENETKIVMRSTACETPPPAVPPLPLTSTPNSSRASDCVEEFVGDVPFAGLFKGSTLNLANDEIDGFAYPSSRLRSPSLVKSVAPIPPKRNIVTKTTEDFDASKVWEEINSILESIGNEMCSDGDDDQHEAIIEENTFNANEEPTLAIATPKPIKIRNPSELLLGMKRNSTTKWCHSPTTLIYGQIVYEVYYLGSTVIRELQGTMSTRKSIQKLKRGETPLESEQDSSILENCNSSTKFLKAANEKTRLKVGIAVSHAGVRFIDATEKSTICVHDIQNINCVCQDVEDLRYFAYITKEQELHYCHVFMVDNLDLATEIILTLGQAFEVAYQLALVKENNSQ